ncbi:MAG: hypothetical protein COA43_10340 [Robiginitomaculum sp.]|nr:MAG: hypothetical protein COA43_10340 [Robiginitomaculum sp.]
MKLVYIVPNLGSGNENIMMKRFFRNVEGGFAVIFAVGLLAFILCVGVAIDLTNVTKAKAQLQDVVDTAALAGAILAADDQSRARLAVRDMIVSNYAANERASLTGAPSIVFDESAREVTVTAEVLVENAVMGIAGYSSSRVTARTTSSYGVDFVTPFAVMMALDVSGSMSWTPSGGDEPRLDSMKSASESLFNTLYEESDDKGLFSTTIHSGFGTYNTALRARLNLHIGYRDTIRSVNELVAGGGTNSTPAVVYAYNQLIADRNEQENWSGYLLFMTDGDNNNIGSDISTINACNRAKANDIVIFTVAFGAGVRGQNLLRDCASGPENFYNSTDGDDLVAAFEDIAKEINKIVIRVKR